MPKSETKALTETQAQRLRDLAYAVEMAQTARREAPARRRLEAYEVRLMNQGVTPDEIIATRMSVH